MTSFSKIALWASPAASRPSISPRQIAARIRCIALEPRSERELAKLTPTYVAEDLRQNGSDNDRTFASPRRESLCAGFRAVEHTSIAHP